MGLGGTMSSMSLNCGSLRTRQVIFAYMFGPPRFVEKKEAYDVHEAICDAVAWEDFSLQYQKPEATRGPQSRAFSIRMSRRMGRGGYSVVIDNQGIEAPIRLVIDVGWPESSIHVNEAMDHIARATFVSLKGDWQKVSAEVRIKAQCDVGAGAGVDFFRNTVFRFSDEWYAQLGRELSFSAARFTTPSYVDPENAMAGAKRDVTLEVLREEATGIYIETVNTWGQFSEGPNINVGQVRPFESSPSEYVTDSAEYLEELVQSLTQT